MHFARGPRLARVGESGNGVVPATTPDYSPTGTLVFREAVRDYLATLESAGVVVQQQDYMDELVAHELGHQFGPKDVRIREVTWPVGGLMRQGDSTPISQALPPPPTPNAVKLINPLPRYFVPVDLKQIRERHAAPAWR